MLIVKSPLDQRVEVFNRDAARHDGYVYTTNRKLSSRWATQRSTDVVLAAAPLRGAAVLDMGCGDGFYTLRFWDQGQPGRMVAVDAAARAVRVARSKAEDRPIEFLIGDVHRSPCSDGCFDLVLLQNILHHDDDPARMIAEAFRLAPRIVLHEPNGNNPGLKIIEKTSRYHREHQEKSYAPLRLRRWIEAAGARVIHETYAGFVPMFCPDWLARLMKTIEPVVEHTPLLKTFGCAVYVALAERKR